MTDNSGGGLDDPMFVEVVPADEYDVVELERCCGSGETIESLANLPLSQASLTLAMSVPLPVLANALALAVQSGYPNNPAIERRDGPDGNPEFVLTQPTSDT